MRKKEDVFEGEIVFSKRDRTISEGFQRRRRFFEEFFNGDIPKIHKDNENGVFNQEDFKNKLKNAFNEYKKRFKPLSYLVAANISGGYALGTTISNKNKKEIAFKGKLKRVYAIGVIEEEFVTCFSIFFKRAIRECDKKYWGSYFEVCVCLLTYEAVYGDAKKYTLKGFYKIYKKWRETNAY